MMLRNNTPVMRSMMRGGSYTMWARTTEVSITLPSHVSMLTGVVPERHAIWWNIEIDKEYMRYPSVPTIFELAKARGLTTALAVGKGKLDALGRKGSLDWAYWPDGYAQAVNTEDTFATACYLLKIPMDEDVDGKAVLQVMEDAAPPEEMLVESSAKPEGYVPYKGE